MSNNIHITTARIMLSQPEPLDIKLWDKTGKVLHLKNCIGLKYDHKSGTRNVKMLDSREIRKIRDCCIFEINNMNVFL